MFAAALAVAAFELFLVAKPLAPVQLTVVDELLLAGAGAVAALACRARGDRETARSRVGWRLLTLCCASFSVSQVAFAAQSYLDRTADLTSSATLGNLFAALSCPLALAALVCLVGRMSTTSRILSLLDGFVISLSLLFLGWAVALGPLFRDLHSDSLAKAVNLLFTGTAVACVAIVAMLAMRWRGDSLTLVLFGVSFTWLTVSNLGYALLSARGTYVTGNNWIDVGWLGSFLIVGLAAGRPVSAEDAGTERRRWWLALLIPYGAVLLVAVTTLVMWIREAEFDLFIDVVGMLVVVIALARQLVTLLENHSLNRDLEARVEERSAAARASEERLASLLHNSSDVIAVINSEARLRYASPAARNLFGVDPIEFIGSEMSGIVHPDDQPRTRDALERVVQDGLTATTASFRVQTMGGYRQIEATMSALRDDPIGEGIILNLRDVSERAALQAELQRQASYDSLTSLANRRLFNERLAHSIERARRSGEYVSVLFIDIDHFKRVNDSAGHASGDDLLVQIADRLRTCLRPADTAARLGGDEFAILLEDTDALGAEHVASRIIKALEPGLHVAGRQVQVTASIGIAATPGGKDDIDVLMRDADVAMYQAKANGRARYAVFQQSMHTRVVEQLELETELRDAAANSELRVMYQPIVDLSTFEVFGLEALLRWKRRGDADVPPSLFIPLAEEAGLIESLDYWVLMEACRQVASWQRRFPRHADLRLSVNISALEVQDTHIVDTVAAVLESTGLAGRHLVLEITETAILPELPVIDEVIEALHGLGVGVSLDDFGTGYSSLAALRRFHLDEIKLDRSFVQSLERSPHGRSLVQSIISMAQVLNLHTVAEGVETTDQLELLQQLGCRTGQGFLLSKPKAAPEIERMFAAPALHQLSTVRVMPGDIAI